MASRSKFWQTLQTCSRSRKGQLPLHIHTDRRSRYALALHGGGECVSGGGTARYTGMAVDRPIMSYPTMITL